MIDLPVLAAAAVVIGAVAAVTARDGRVVVLGLMLAAVLSSVVASPLPDSLAITARILGAMLAAYLLWATVGSAPINSSGSALGPAAEVAAAVAAFGIGLSIRPVDPLAGPLVAQAAGLALVALAIAPLAGRDVFRMGIGVALLSLGCSLLIAAWSGPTPALEQLAVAALLVGIAGATSVLIPSPAAQPALDTGAIEPVVEAKVGPLPRIRPAPAHEPSFRAPIARRADGSAGVAAPPAEAVRPAPPRLPASPRPASPRPAPATPQLRAPEPLPEPAPRRPMTADPIEPDAWAAWNAPEPFAREPLAHEPEPEPRRRLPGARKLPSPDQATPSKPEPKKQTRSRPDLRGKP